MGSASVQCVLSTTLRLRMKSGKVWCVTTSTGLGYAAVQGLEFVHFPAQCKRILWDRECT